MSLNLNTRKIINHIISRELLKLDENLNEDGTVNWSFVEADVAMDAKDVDVHCSYELNYDDIDSAFDALVARINAGTDVYPLVGERVDRFADALAGS